MSGLFRSLRAKLLALFGAMILTGAVVTLLAVNISTRTQFNAYVQQSDLRRAESLASVLGSYFTLNGSWDGVGELLGPAQRFAPSADDEGTFSPPATGVFGGNARPPGAAALRSGARMMGGPAARAMIGGAGSVAAARALGPARIVLTDSNGSVIFDSSPRAADIALSRAATEHGVDVVSNGRTVGRILLGAMIDRSLDPIQQKFLDSVQLGILLSALSVAVVALILGSLFLSGVVRPVHGLRVAAEQIAAGNLNARTPPHRNDEIGDLTRSFERMRDSLGREKETRVRLFRDIAHELRTPVALLQGEVEAMLDGIYPMSRESVGSLQDEIRMLARLISDVQMVANLDAGTLEMRMEPVDVAELCAAVAERFRRAADGAGMKITTNVEGNLPSIEGDDDRLAQVLGNLVNNAIVHADGATEIRITAHSRRTSTEPSTLPAASSLPGFPTDGVVEIEIRDDGRGVGEQDLPRLFDRMFRVDPARSRKTGGSGLGLSIAESIVRAHGGSLTAQSPPPGAESGLQLLIRLPTTRHAGLSVL